jgi:hypothetical protein
MATVNFIHDFQNLQPECVRYEARHRCTPRTELNEESSNQLDVLNRSYMRCAEQLTEHKHSRDEP